MATHQKFCYLCNWSGGDLIVACPSCCTYSHRRCLNEVRANVDKPHLIYSCHQCRDKYKLIRPSHSSLWRFYAHVTLDLFLVFLVFQAIVFIFAFCVKHLDAGLERCLDECSPTGDTCEICPPIRALFFPAFMSAGAVYYVCGVVVFLAFVGLFGLCSEGCGPRSSVSSSSSGTVHHGDCCCILDCNCPETKKKDDGVALIVIAVLVVIVLAAFGVFYGMALSAKLFTRTMDRHVQRLKVESVCRDYAVANLLEPVNEDIPFAEIVAEVQGRLL